MLIRSQDRKTLANMRNTGHIGVWDSAGGIVVAHGEGSNCILGEYATERRCEEIITDICEQYKNFINFPGAEGNAVFQMPEE